MGAACTEARPSSLCPAGFRTHLGVHAQRGVAFWGSALPRVKDDTQQGWLPGAWEAGDR